MKTSEIITLTGMLPGPTVAIFAGIHGNELAGVYALEKLIPKLTLSCGTVHFAYANPPAIKAGVRMINKNLNRCFYKGNTGTSYEDNRARELMQVLDKCDGLLDLHMFYDDDGQPFVICEDNSLKIAKKFDVDIISTNWTKVEPGGTDGYMFEQGKVGVCVECGPISKAKSYTSFAEQTVLQFLSHYNMLEVTVAPSTKPKRYIRAQKAITKSSSGFTLEPGYKNFQALEKGQLIASDKNKSLLAKADECIIFPHYSARIGEEAYIIGVEL